MSVAHDIEISRDLARTWGQPDPHPETAVPTVNDAAMQIRAELTLELGYAVENMSGVRLIDFGERLSVPIHDGRKLVAGLRACDRVHDLANACTALGSALELALVELEATRQGLADAGSGPDAELEESIDLSKEALAAAARLTSR